MSSVQLIGFCEIFTSFGGKPFLCVTESVGTSVLFWQFEKYIFVDRVIL